MRTLYPDIAYGAIASSGVIHAQLDSWQYFEPIRQNGPPACIEALMRTVSQIDHILINGTHKDKHALKSQFGLQGISSDADFTNILTEPLSNWQALTWQRSYARNPFYEMCETLGRYVDPMYGFAEYVRREIASTCKDPKEQDGCFGTFDVEQYQQDSLEEEWRLWTWQYCTEWGYCASFHPLYFSHKLMTIHFSHWRTPIVPPKPGLSSARRRLQRAHLQLRVQPNFATQHDRDQPVGLVRPRGGQTGTDRRIVGSVDLCNSPFSRCAQPQRH